MKVLSDGGFKAKYGALFMTPAETRAEFERLGWSKVAAFQTRNPMHRSHEYLAKVAIEVCDGVLIHSLLGNLKPGDIPAEVRTRAISVLTDKYFVGKTVVQAGYPARHALRRTARGAAARALPAELRLLAPDRRPRPRGRRELLRALRRAPHLRPDSAPAALETQPLKIDWTFWCYQCGGMASARTCPHGDADRLLVSGTKLRKWLSEGAEVPAEFSRPEVLEILRQYYATIDAKDRVEVKLTGHSAR